MASATRTHRYNLRPRREDKNTPPPPSLFDLPAEIRLAIYRHLLIVKPPRSPYTLTYYIDPAARQIWTADTRDDGLDDDPFGHLCLEPAILRCSRAAHAEAAPVLYGENLFDVLDCEGAPHEGPFVAPPSPLSPRNAALITTASFAPAAGDPAAPGPPLVDRDSHAAAAEARVRHFAAQPLLPALRSLQLSLSASPRGLEALLRRLGPLLQYVAAVDIEVSVPPREYRGILHRLGPVSDEHRAARIAELGQPPRRWPDFDCQDPEAGRLCGEVYGPGAEACGPAWGPGKSIGWMLENRSRAAAWSPVWVLRVRIR